MVDHQVCHELVFGRDSADVLPVTQVLANLAIINDRETVVRAEREKWQYVDTTDRTEYVFDTADLKKRTVFIVSAVDQDGLESERSNTVTVDKPVRR